MVAETCLTCGETITGAYTLVGSPNNPPVLIGYQCESCYDGGPEK